MWLWKNLASATTNILGPAPTTPSSSASCSSSDDFSSEDEGSQAPCSSLSPARSTRSNGDRKMPAVKGFKLPPAARSPKARLPPVAIGTKRQDKGKDLEGQGRAKEEEEESQQHEETASSLPRQGEAHTGELGVRDALDHLNQVSRELRDAREMSDELLDIIRNTNPTTYEEILNSTKNTKLRDIMKKAKTTTGETTPEGFRRISALIQDNNQVFFDRFMASLSCGAKLKLADVEVLTRECHRQMASLVDERASGSSIANAGAQAGGNGSGGRGAGGASSASPPSLGGDNGNSDAGGRASDGEGAVTLPDLALVQNMAVADALPRFVNALLHQKEQEQQQQQQQQQQQPGVPKFTFGKARPVPSSPPGLKTVGTSTDNETGGAAAAAAAATVPPARCGESYTSAVAGSGASWRSDSDMPARRKMFAAIVKFFEKYKPSTLPEWVHKRTSFPIAVEALLYKQASSLGDYDDSTTVGSRVSHIIRSMGKEIMAAMLKADETTHSNESKDEQQPHNCQTALASIPERGVVPSKDLKKLHMAQQAVRAAQTPEEKAAVEAKAMGAAAAAAAAAAPAYAAAAPAAAAVGSRKDEEGSRKQPAMSRAERRAAERERVKGAAKAAKSARLQQHLTQQSLRKNNDPRRVEGQLLAAADNPPPAGAQPVPPPETKPGDKTETKPGGKTGQKVVPDGGGDNGAGAGAGAGAAVNDIAALGGKRAAAAAAAGARTPPKTEKKAENETKTSATAVPSPTRTRTGVAVAAAAAGSRTSIPSEPAAAPGKAQTAQPARAAKAHAPTAATKREDSQAPAEERGNRAAARAPAAVLEETVTEMSSSRPSPGGEWTWPLMALDGGGALKGKRAAAAPLRRFAWIGRAADPTAGNRAEPVPWGNWKRWRDPEKWEKMVSTAITRYSDAEYGGKL